MRKTKLSSRRRRTLRRILIAAAAVFLVNRIFLIGLLFPVQAIRHNEEREGAGRTAVVCRDWAPEIYKSQLVYLTENEDITMLSGARLTYLGWINGYGVMLDCTEEAPVHGGWLAWSEREQSSILYAFGRVDGPDIARLEVRLQYTDWKGEDHTALTWNSEREDWMEKDGRHYFLFRTYPPFDWTEYHPRLDAVAVGYDEAGLDIAWVELSNGSGSISS
nr:hypothetical protein [uncultured Oscillibacter sp.]